MSLTRTEYAQFCGKDTRTIQRWIDDGMPCQRKGRKYLIEQEVAQPWLCEYLPRAPKGSEGDRLRKEQADKFALDNEERRGQLLRLDHVTEVMTAAASNLSSQLDGVAGRLANEVAGEHNPSVIRQIILDEHHRIRSAYADQLKKLFQRPAPREDAEGDPESAAEEPKPKPKAKSKPKAKRKQKPAAKRKPKAK